MRPDRDSGWRVAPALLAVVVTSSVIVGLAAGGAPIPATTASMSSVTASSHSPALVITDVTAGPNTTVRIPITVQNGSNIAGYQANLSFDPTVLQVQQVVGQANFTTVAKIDNSSGWVRVSGAKANGSAAPVVAELVVNVVGKTGETTRLAFAPAGTSVNNESSQLPTRLNNGTVTVSPITIGIGNFTAGPNATVRAPIFVKNGSDIAGYQAILVFNPRVVQVKDVIGRNNFTTATSINNTTGRVRLSGAKANGTPNPVVADIVFEVIGEAGETTRVGFAPEFTSVNNESSQLPSQLDNGTVTISAVSLGDVNGDGAINTGDVIQVQRSIVGLSTDPAFSSTAADVNNDGSINTGDVIQIQRFIVGLSSVLD